MFRESRQGLSTDVARQTRCEGEVLGTEASGGRCGRGKVPTVGRGPWRPVRLAAMCGRYVSTSTPDEIAKYFDAQPPEEELLEPNYNVAPTQDVYAVLEDGGVRKVEALHWGLVPFWAKDPSVGNRMINARAEGIETKNAYRRAYRKRRCIIPADGFYEWVKATGHKHKQPVFMSRPDGEPFAFAGLWEVWRNPDNPDEELHSCTIITAKPNEKVAKIHDRMPVILPPSAWSTWLDREQEDIETLGKLLVPAPASLISLRLVSTEVNNVRNKGPHLMDAAEPIIPLDALGLEPADLS
jgi:putative SOS response-associated peptidase YedK